MGMDVIRSMGGGRPRFLIPIVLITCLDNGKATKLNREIADKLKRMGHIGDPG